MVEYSCSVEGGVLYWLVNGSSYIPPNSERVITHAMINDSPAMLSSNLTFIAVSNMNGSNIACNSINNNTAVILFIQGQSV